MTATDLAGVVRVLEALPWFPEASRPVGVIIASNNLNTRLLLAHHLESLGYGIWTAGCGTDAYQTAIEHPVSVDILVCDEAISDIPVPDLYSKLKTRLPGLHCCVLATTRQKARAAEAARLGAVVIDVSHPSPEPAAELTAASAW